jgi:hypothetical protein
VSEASHIEWSRSLFHGLRVGGVWGVPRSGLIFTRVGENVLALTDVMPHTPDMPGTPRDLFDQQAGDFREIQSYMKKAGVTTIDRTDTFDPD